MAVLKCEACGAPLTSKNGVYISVCEYCGTENVLSDTTTSFVPQEPNYIDENPVVLSLASIGSTIFEKKTFVIYRNYAELIDTKTNFAESHIDFNLVAKYGKAWAYGNAIKFKMSDGKKYIVRFMWENNLNLAMKALDGLIKNI